MKKNHGPRKYPKFNDAQKYLECRVSSSPLGFLKSRAEQSALDRCLEGLTGLRTICDVPSGPGRLFKYWKSRDLQVIGADLSGDMLAAARQEHAKLGLSGGMIEADAFTLKEALKTGPPDLVASVRFAYYFDSGERVRLLRSLAAASRRYVLVQYKTTETLKGQMNIARAAVEAAGESRGHKERKEHLSKEGCSHQRMADEVVKAGLVPLRIVPMGELSDRVFILAEKPGADPAAPLRHSIRANAEQPSILFCGKHRVNFAMFHPVYNALKDNPNIRLLVSSGRYRLKPILGWRKPKEADLVNEDLFREFNLDPKHLHKTSVSDKYPYDVFVTSNKTTLIEPPNSRVKVQIFHGVSFRNFAVDPGYLRYDKLFFPGRYMMEQYIRRGYLKEGDPRIELMGMPKLDRLVDGTIKREDVLRRLGLDPAVPTVLWCPTGARHNSFEILGQEGLKALQATGFNLILKLHDHPHLPKGVTREDYIQQAKEAMGKRGRIEDHSDVAPLLVAADLLISDASSVAYEYCLRNRPIIFVDVPDLINARAEMEGANIDQESHGRSMGRIVKGAEDLKEAIVHALAHPEEFEAERRATADHIFHKPGTATQRMAERLLELAGAVEPASRSAGEPDAATVQAVPRVRIKVRQPARVGLGLIAAAVFALMYSINFADKSFWSGTEASHALAARSVSEGHAFVPHIMEGVASRVAPLYSWLTAAVSAPLGGVSEWTGRMTAMIASLSLLGFTLAFARRWLNPWSGFLALIVLGTSYQFWDASVTVAPASTAALCLFIAWRALFPLLTQPLSYWPRWTGLWLGLGVAMLAQGWSALFLTIAMAATYAFTREGWRAGVKTLWSLKPLPGLALAFAPCLAWWLGAVRELNLGSFGQTWDAIPFLAEEGSFGPNQPWHYYLTALPLGMLPWVLLMPWAFAHAWSYVRTGPSLKSRAVGFAICGALVPPVYHSLFERKDASAMLAALPWFAILAGDFIWHRLCGVLPKDLSDDVRKINPLDTDARSFGGRVLGLGLGRFVIGAVAVCGLAVAVYSGFIADYLEHRETARNFAAEIGRAVDSDDHLMLVDGEDPRLLFYLGESFELVDDGAAAERIKELAGAGGEMDLVLKEGDVYRLARASSAGLFVGGTETYRDRLYYLLTNEFKPGMDPFRVAPVRKPSGMCYSAARNSFFIVNDEGTVAEVARDGTLLHSRRLGGDLEAVAVRPDGKAVYIADESADEIHEIDAETLEEVESYQIKFPSEIEDMRRNPEQGIEGIFFAADSPEGKAHLYAVNEDNPPMLMRMSLAARSGNEEGRANIESYSALAMGDLTELTASNAEGTMLAYSRIERRLVELAPDGKSLRAWHLPEGKREALTLLADGTLYMCDESSLMRVFDPSEMDRLLIPTGAN